MSQFEYRVLDQEGLETLEAIAVADAFNQWMYETIKPFCRGKIVEIGSGIGNISQFFLQDNFDITLSDIRENYKAILRRKFSRFTNLSAIVQLDLVVDSFETQYASYLHSFDCIFALNVVEHIQNDRLAISNASKLLKSGGRMIILVPAYQKLYNGFDVQLEHFRRYSSNGLNDLMHGCNLRVIHSQYFNFAGILGWYFSGTILKKEIIPASQMKLYNHLVPLFRLVDKIFLNKVGLSVISVAEKS